MFLHDPFSMIHLASVARFSGGVIPNARGPANISHVSKGYVYYAGTWHHKYVCLLFVGNSLCSINACNHAILQSCHPAFSSKMTQTLNSAQQHQGLCRSATGQQGQGDATALTANVSKTYLRTFADKKRKQKWSGGGISWSYVTLQHHVMPDCMIV